MDNLHFSLNALLYSGAHTGANTGANGDNFQHQQSELSPDLSPPKKIRIANIGFLNCLPYTLLKDLSWVDYREHSPAESARLLHEGMVDLACIPLAECWQYGTYGMLPWGIIARGAVKSVLLISPCELDEIESVVIDAASYSSVALLRILLCEQLGERGKHIPFWRTPSFQVAAQIGGKVAGLMVGDRALEMKHTTCRLHDLGAMWKALTGHDFVFGVWAGRTELLTPNLKDELETSIERGLALRDVLAKNWAHRCGKDEPTAVSYLRDNISYYIDYHAEQGIAEFARLGVYWGLFPKRTSVNYMTASPFETSPQQLHLPLKYVYTDNLSSSLLNPLARTGNPPRLSICDALLMDKSSQQEQVAYTEKFMQHAASDKVFDITGHVLTGHVLSGHGVSNSSSNCLSKSFSTWCEELKAAKSVHQTIRGFSPQDIAAFANCENTSLSEILKTLKEVGLDILGSVGGDILIDSYRQMWGHLTLASEDWLAICRLAHVHGIRTEAELVVGLAESSLDRLTHLKKLRNLQDETNGIHRLIVRSAPFGVDPEEFKQIVFTCQMYVDNIPVEVEEECVADKKPTCGEYDLSLKIKPLEDTSRAIQP